MRPDVFWRRPKCALLLLFAVLHAHAQTQPLVSRGDTWRYRKNGSAVTAGWKTMADANLPASWLSGPGGFGYADNTAETALVQTPLLDMQGVYSTVAIRKSFEIAEAIDPAQHIYLRVDFDDGFIAWLDGVYLTSANSPGAPAEPAYNAIATSNHESSLGDGSAEPSRLIDLGPVGSRLTVGAHILAILGLNVSSGSSDFIIIADLFLGPPPPADCKSGTIATDAIWRSENGNPISVCGDVTVAAGATLAIEPGTTVELSDGANINVSVGGRLVAEGTAQDRIRFAAAPLASRWGGIEILGGADSIESRIAFADFSGNGSTAIHTDGATVCLDHLNFLATDHAYVSLDRSSFILSECHFPKPTARFEPVHGSGGIKAGGYAVMRRNYFGGTIGYNDVVDFTGGNRPGPILHFINNVIAGGDDDGLDLDGTDAWVEGNIFLHLHRNGDSPDSASAISGGNDSTRTSEVTIVNNIIFDCDNGATGKQGNFYALINNTIVHTTKTGGIDVDSGVVTLREITGTPTTFARGMYLERNVIWDAEKLARNYDPAQTTVTFNANLLPMSWGGPGGENIVADPQFLKTPALQETAFANWAEAQVLWEWLQPRAPIAAGRGAARIGVEIRPDSGNENFSFGFNIAGNGIPATGWPSGCGYTHYKWRLDGGAWSSDVPIAQPLALGNLPVGGHVLEVSGKRDSSLYQDDPIFGADANATSFEFYVSLQIAGISSAADGTLTLTFLAQAGQTYQLWKRESFDVAHPWELSGVILPYEQTGLQTIGLNSPNASTHFYRIAIPAP